MSNEAFSGIKPQIVFEAPKDQGGIVDNPQIVSGASAIAHSYSSIMGRIFFEEELAQQAEAMKVQADWARVLAERQRNASGGK